MSEKVRKLAISLTAYKNLPENFSERLRERENIKLFVVGDDMIHEVKKLVSQDISGVIILKEEAIEEIKTECIAEQICRLDEIKIPDIREEFVIKQNNKSQQKKYVPKKIGIPQNKKRGSR